MTERPFVDRGRVGDEDVRPERSTVFTGRAMVPRRGWVGEGSAAAAVYVAASAASALLAARPGAMTSIMLAEVATFWLLSRAEPGRRLPLLACAILAGLAFHIAAGESTIVAVATLAASALEIGLSLVVLDRLSTRYDPSRRPVDFLVALGAIGLLVPAVTAAVAAAALTAAGEGAFGPLAFRWCSGSGTGMAVMLPLALLGRDVERRNWRTMFGRSKREVLGHVLAAAATGFLAVWLLRYPYVAITIPLTVAALRLKPLGLAVLWPVLLAAIVSADVVVGWPRFGADAGPVHLSAMLMIVPPICVSLVVDMLEREGRRIHESEHRFRRAMDDSPLGMAFINFDGTFGRANRVLGEMLGHDAEELLGLTVYDVTHPEDRHECHQAITDLREGRTDRFRFEKRYRRKNGEVFWVLATGSLIRDETTGAPAYVVSQVLDIDAEKRVEALVAESENRWNFALESARQGVWDVDLATKQSYFSQTWRSLLGYTREEIEQADNDWTAFVHPEDLEAALAANREHIEGRAPEIEIQIRMRHKDGRWIWMLDRGRIIERAEDGTPLRMVGTLTELDRLKRAENEVAVVNQRLALAVRVTGMGLWTWSPVTREVWWDARMYELFGLPEGSVRTGDEWIARIVPEDVQILRSRMLYALSKNEMFDCIYRIRRPNGDLRHLQLLGRVFHDRVTGADLMLGTALDITAQKTMEHGLREANERMSQFAAIASHDLQAPLRQMALYADILRHDLAGRLQADEERTVGVIIRKARELQQLIRSLLDFSRSPTNIRHMPVSMAAVVATSVDELSLDIREMEAQIEVGPLPDVIGDPLLLGQVMQNVIGNALKYRGAEPPRVRIEGTLASDGAVEIVVSDNGPGIDSHSAETIFEAFRRLPGARGVAGAGLGLALCRRILLALNGDIRLLSDKGPGSAFVIRLPAAYNSSTSATDA